MRRPPRRGHRRRGRGASAFALSFFRGCRGDRGSLVSTYPLRLARAASLPVRGRYEITHPVFKRAAVRNEVENRLLVVVIVFVVVVVLVFFGQGVGSALFPPPRDEQGRANKVTIATAPVATGDTVVP